MSKPKITGMIIGTILISFFAIAFSSFIVDISLGYGIEYDNTTLQSFDKLRDITREVETIKSNTTELNLEPNLPDIIGGYFTSAYRTLTLTKNSFTLLGEMAEPAIDNLQIGLLGSVLKTTLTTILVVLIFIGVFMAAIIKRDL